MDEMKFVPADHFMDLKGKKYLQVMWRLVWFRQDHPDWQIRSEIVEHVYGDHAVFKAWIIDPAKEMIFAEAHGSESVKDFKDYLEKAETKAIGRALAMLGYGTQFAPELDEEERIVDSPVERKRKPAPEPVVEKPVIDLVCHDCGARIIDVVDGNGKTVSAARIADSAVQKFGRPLCVTCAKKEKLKNAGN